MSVLPTRGMALCPVFPVGCNAVAPAPWLSLCCGLGRPYAMLGPLLASGIQLLIDSAAAQAKLSLPAASSEQGRAGLPLVSAPRAHSNPLPWPHLI